MPNFETYTVLESAITISGKLLVALNTFEIKIPIGSQLQDSKGNQWVITGIDKNVFHKLDTSIKKKAIELGAVLYMIESINSNMRPKVNDYLFVK